ncbi:methyltransferase domain-containing protein [Paraburkholderia aspalathi]|uniref:hypothetical protein n=1 Tax=Paraburkholderia aspalathi TaxID=1324617 RepID=UPI0038B92B27
MDRAAFLTSGISRENFGIEIGAFHNPIAPKAHGWKTTVVDFTDQAGLLNVARNHTSQIMRDMASNIEVVDIVWRGQPLDEACLAIRQEGFRYLIASHVIEHVPDIIGFLGQISRLADDNFILSLAVPDCRQTFDYFKPLSSTADALLAHRHKRIMHCPETMFVAYAYASWLDGVGAWQLGATGALTLPDSLDHAHSIYLSYLEKLENGTQPYKDSHCWHWTPSSFQLMMLELNHLGYIDFVIDECEQGPSSEFLVRLKRGKYRLESEELHNRRLQLLMQTKCELAEASAMSPILHQEADVDLQSKELRSENALLQSKIDEQEAMLAEERVNLAIAQQRILDLENSTSWRITKPLRATKSLLR